MQNFVFHNPTKVIFGKDTVPTVGHETKAVGNTALLVYGVSSLKAGGTFNQIYSALQENEVKVVEFGKVAPNPTLSQVREGIALAKKKGIDVIVAAGGGSVIDTAKAIGAGAVVEHDVWKFFIGKKGVKATLPVVTVLTIPGSGSEMNSGMVLTHDEKKQKFGFGHRFLHPVTSILDPELTYSLPPEYTAYGAVDALCHILEFYLTTADDDITVQARLMEGLMENIMTACTRCLANPHDYHGRATLMWSATLALNGLTAAGLGKVGFPMHLLEHAISGRYNTPHGAGLGALLAGWLNYYRQAAPKRLATLGNRIFAVAPQPSEQEAIDLCITSIMNWLKQIAVPITPQSLGVTPEDIPKLAESTAPLAKIWRLREYPPTLLEQILRYRHC
ncbi:MAG: NADH-dependent alcohol dehydrogenase [Desulfobulbus propionicus]|nr:MAG: NADH-dependent alcohol dehydrogenase [Desulfobulbus propionicus]